VVVSRAGADPPYLSELEGVLSSGRAKRGRGR
jgi:hypothetical protein